ncbi:MAG: FAD:protein FMN transferase [Deltaproteobacteria bacterium]|nr:FAD:protein FMN transferase [Deltaproteobacteria bacterium]
MKNHIPSSQKHEIMNRRAFLKLSGLLGLGLTSTSILPVTAEAVKFNNKTYKVSETRVAMGTFVSMTLFNPSRDKAEEAMGHAFEEIDRLTGLLNRFDHKTALAQLNNEGFLNDVPTEVAEVVARALDYYRISSGTFDISVKPVIDLFKRNFAERKNALPDRTELDNALKLVGSDKIELKGRTIRFKKPGVGITLDGIAKGYIVDRASKTIADHQVKDHLINAGGDIRTNGSSQGKKPWTVAIQDPQKNRHYPDIIHMTDGAIATSGNYEIYFDREKMFHHIVDPKTGMSPEVSSSVSVLADTAMNADALSTSVFVMKPAVGIRFIDSIPGCECLVMSRAGKIFKSPGWTFLAT